MRLAVRLGLILILTVPAFAQVTTLTATLLGANERPNPGDADGSGFAIVHLDRASGTVRYALVVRDISPPAGAHIHRGGADVAGGVVVDFAPSWFNGTAVGTANASAALIDEILANPAGFYVNVHNADYPGGAVRGQLMNLTTANATDVLFPIAGRVVGANNTFYRTDVYLLNLSGASTPVVLEYYASGSAANNAPTATATITVANNEQVNLSGDMLQNTLGIGNGTGALRVVAPGRVIATARIYNDRRSFDGGTLGQFIPALGAEYNRTTGALPMLANEQGLNGYRANIGWFNASTTTATVTFRVHRPNGTVLQTTTLNVPRGQQMQMPIGQIFNTLEPLDQLYVTFTTAGAPLYVYASVVDNTNGDAIFIPAQPR